MADGSFQPIDKPKRRKLDRDRFSDLAQPKHVRIIDDDVLEEARRRGYCEWCGGEVFRADASHSVNRSLGGDDTRLNITSLCRTCHRRHHDGFEPTTYQLLEIARVREAGRIGEWHPKIIGSRLNIARSES